MVTWTAPANEGYYYLTCTVDDGRGGQAADSIGIVVQDFSNVGTGIPVAYYPFNGNANDESGLGNHGIIYGAILGADRFGNPNSAYYFDGLNDYIRVPNHPILNFQDEISVSFWMNIEQFFSREAYPISHGNWENRWKVCIIPDKKVRWTIKTDYGVNSGIKDLDSQTQLVADTFYNVTVLYDGSAFEFYIDGVLDASSYWSGRILSTTIDLTIGQVLPDNYCCNFKGVLDDIRIYNYALSVEEIQNIYNEITSIKDKPLDDVPENYILHQIYPNPFIFTTTICYQLPVESKVKLKIYSLTGQLIRKLVNTKQEVGCHKIDWDGKDTYGNAVSAGIYFCRLKIESDSGKSNFISAQKVIAVR